MKKTVLRAAALVLVCAVICMTFVSCKGKTDKSDTSDSVSGSTEQGKTSDPENTESSGAYGSNETVTSDTSETSGNSEENTYTMLEGKTPVLTDGAYAVRDLSYGSRVDMSSAAAKASSQIFDLYLPKRPGNIPENAQVFLYIHGGSWSEVQYTKDNDNTWLCKELAASGMVVFSMNYVLAGSRDSGDSVDDMMKDIDAMLAHAKKLLSELGVKATSCGIGGNSAGGHLSALYAYRYGNKAPLRTAFEVDVVGPVDLMIYKPVIDSYIQLAGSFSVFSSFQVSGLSFSKIFGSMAGMKTVTEADLPKLWEKMNELSPVNYVTKNSCPTILVYGLREHKLTDMMPADVKGDGMVPISCYDELTEKLKANGVPYSGKVYEGYSHGDLPWKAPANDWIKSEIHKYADTYIK